MRERGGAREVSWGDKVRRWRSGRGNNSEVGRVDMNEGGGSERGRRASTRGDGAGDRDGSGKKRDWSEKDTAEGEGSKGRGRGTDGGKAASKRVSKSVARDASMALDPTERDHKGAGANAEEGPDSQDSLDIGRGVGTRREDQ